MWFVFMLLNPKSGACGPWGGRGLPCCDDVGQFHRGHEGHDSQTALIKCSRFLRGISNLGWSDNSVAGECSLCFPTLHLLFFHSGLGSKQLAQWTTWER